MSCDIGSPGVDGPARSEYISARRIIPQHIAEPQMTPCRPNAGAASLEIRMKLASYKVRGRESFGAIVGQGSGEGVVDLKTRLAPQFTSVFDLLRADRLDTARAAMHGVRADFPLAELEFLAPVPAPEKILCIGINYANRNADFGDAELPKYPSMFYRAPGSLVGSPGKNRAAARIRAARLRGRDRAGDRRAGPPHRA